MADSTSSHSDSSSSPNSSSSSSLKELTHSALQLVHWKQPKKSAAAFSLSLLVLISVATLSVISVVSYLLLACLCVTITFRVYKSVIQAIQKSDEGHPFRSLLETDISVSSESVRQLADQSLIHLNWFSSQTRRLLLVEDLVDSLKLAAAMWVMTYVGAVFNGVTILILADIIFFTTPLVYQKNKTKIDQNIDLVRCRLEETLYKMTEGRFIKPLSITDLVMKKQLRHTLQQTLNEQLLLLEDHEEAAGPVTRGCEKDQS